MSSRSSCVLLNDGRVFNKRIKRMRRTQHLSFGIVVASQMSRPGSKELTRTRKRPSHKRAHMQVPRGRRRKQRRTSMHKCILFDEKNDSRMTCLCRRKMHKRLTTRRALFVLLAAALLGAAWAACGRETGPLPLALARLHPSASPRLVACFSLS